MVGLIFLAFVKEGRALGILGRRSSPLYLPARPGRNSDDQSHKEHNAHDDEGKDPLQRNNLASELSDTNSSSENAEGEAHGVILVDANEEQAIAQDGPDEDITKDTGSQISRVGYHQGAVPVNGNKGPCQGCRDDGGMDEARVRVVAEIEGAQVDKVDDEQELCPDEVGADEEHDKGEMEEVVEDKVATDAGGGVDVVGVLGEEVGDVAELQDEEDNPEDIGDGAVHGEGTWVEVVLVPDAPADGEAIMGLVDGVVDRDDDRKEPGEDREDLVGDDRAGSMSLSLGEGVVLAPVSHVDGDGLVLVVVVAMAQIGTGIQVQEGIEGEGKGMAVIGV